MHLTSPRCGRPLPCLPHAADKPRGELRAERSPPPEAGILDYDLSYFDDSDLSWPAEDAVIRAGRELFGDLPAPVQIRTQARVHLRYEENSVCRAMAIPDRPAVARRAGRRRV